MLRRSARGSPRRNRSRYLGAAVVMILPLLSLYPALTLLLQEEKRQPQRIEGTLRPVASPGPPLPEPAARPAGFESSFDAGGLRASVERISKGYPGTYGVEVYDPRSGKRVHYNAGERFYGASLDKLPVLAALYRQAAAGDIDLNEEISILPTDVEDYGSGVLHTYPVGHTLTLRECAYYMVHYSDNTAWAMLERRLGLDEIDDSLVEMGMNGSVYDTHSTTPQDVMRGLRRISSPSYTSPAYSGEMLSYMTDTEFEDRLPAGLPPGARVAHKIGNWDGSYHDAGVVFYTDERGEPRRYLIVVMVKSTDEATARAAIQEISAASYAAVADVR